MTMSQFSPKAVLLGRLREVFLKHESGLLTILTDQNRSIMLRFSAGKLVSARCRSWDIANTIDALLEAETLKFTFSVSAVEDKPELMPAQTFMAHIDPQGPPLDSQTTEAKAVPLVAAVVEPVFEAPASPEPPALVEKPDEQAAEEKRKLDRAVAARTNYF